MKRESIIAWDILTRNVETWIVDKLTWDQAYERGYREPRFPVPAILQHFEWGWGFGTGEIVLIHVVRGVYND